MKGRTMLKVNRIIPRSPPVDTQKLCASLVAWSEKLLVGTRYERRDIDINERERE